MLVFEFFTLVNPLSALNVQFIIFVYMNSDVWNGAVADYGLRLQNNRCFVWCATSFIARNVYFFLLLQARPFFKSETLRPFSLCGSLCYGVHNYI